MNISYNWLKQHVNIDSTPEELSLILTNTGLEVEALDVVQNIPGGLDGLVVGEVKTCEQHPNADKLRVTTVDVGGPELLHIVCGAPNCRTGLKVIVATVGTTCHPLTGEPFKITKSKIRGEVSGFKLAPSGHAYFSLQDENALLSAVCWKGASKRILILGRSLE
jgi:phenylalanyl-tRNA synthetase beta chain